jgi:hypothetical protein
LPVIVEHGYKTVSPYGSYPINNHLHNGETPELYSVHPYRYFSVGRSVLGVQRDLAPALNCLTKGKAIRQTCANGNGNGGWNQGIMNAALLGDATIASAQCISRARTHAGQGYRFQGFAPHEQDCEQLNLPTFPPHLSFSAHALLLNAMYVPPACTCCMQTSLPPTSLPT